MISRKGVYKLVINASKDLLPVGGVPPDWTLSSMETISHTWLTCPGVPTTVDSPMLKMFCVLSKGLPTLLASAVSHRVHLPRWQLRELFPQTPAYDFSLLTCWHAATVPLKGQPLCPLLLFDGLLVLIYWTPTNEGHLIMCIKPDAVGAKDWLACCPQEALSAMECI